MTCSRRYHALTAALLLLATSLLAAEKDDFPLVPEDMEVALFAAEPLVRNPCAIAFDEKARLCVGMGPQYRKPSPDSPGDSVWLLIDDDKDGRADRRQEFAKGLNAIQGLAWRDGALWIANSPDLTVVRDLDGDDEADEYIRLYTDLGNLEHALHGLNWAPDGKLYMSKGNSKGLNIAPDRVAPAPFRDLWGSTSSPGTPDFPRPRVFTKDTYEKHYHDPDDDWGLSGGILRCDPDGTNLEIVARGFRNPWDISFSDGFDWLGTDNDQNYGDKFVSPFYDAHFGWGHPWSYDWKGDDHLPSAPSSGPLFEGSGTGVLYLGMSRYPEHYREVFLVNDWLQRKIYLYRPQWNGAWMQPDREPLEVLADAGSGRSMDRSSGRSFDPVDIELGPDGALYVSSWGREYGAELDNGEMTNEGRIYRLWPKVAPPQASQEDRDPWVDLASPIPVWRTNAQEALVKQGSSAIAKLKSLLAKPETGRNLETWAAWTLGRIDLQDASIDAWFASQLEGTHSQNRVIQSSRILAYRARENKTRTLPSSVKKALQSQDPRLRHEAILAIHQSGESRWNDTMIALTAEEKDRLVYYSAWRALKGLLGETDRRALLGDARAGVRRAALLSLLEEDALSEAEISSFTEDADPTIVALATKRLSGKAEGVIKGPKLSASTEPLIHPQERAPSADEVMALLPNGDATAGRLLFLSANGATCVNCHQLEGFGNVFAPDLSSIALRADPAFIIQSILEPSAAITEGFAMQVVTKKDGETIGGIVLAETGRSLTFGTPSGEQITVSTADIAKRETVAVSAMPALASMLTAQQVADLVTYLTQKRMTIRRESDHVAISLNDLLIAKYYFKHPETYRPFFSHVKTPSGVEVTRSFPPIEGQDPTDHAYMHPGISLGFANLSGENFWHNDRGTVEQVSFSDQENTVKGEARFSVTNQYLKVNRDVLCVERASYRFIPNEDGYLILMESTFSSDNAFYFGVKEEMGLALRVATPITVKNGSGSILSAKGGRNEKGTWGIDDLWWDYFGPMGNRSMGMQIMSGPGNPEVWAHSRDYGVLVANPFPVDRPENAEKRREVGPGDDFTLRFGVQVHDHPAGDDFNPARSFQRFRARSSE